MAGFRGAQFGISQQPPGSQQVGQALMGQAQPPQAQAGAMMPPQAAAPGLLPTLGMGPVMDTGMHSQASTNAAMAEADRRLQSSPDRNAHSTRSPLVAWQLANLGIPKIEIDLDALASGQQFTDDADGDLD